jgi:hypothetical protein
MYGSVWRAAVMVAGTAVDSVDSGLRRTIAMQSISSAVG